MKRQLTEWENISDYRSDKRLISSIYKDLKKSQQQKMNNTVMKWAKDLNRHFS